MKEEFISYCWKYQLFDNLPLKDTEENEIQIINTGSINAFAGPDFENAQLRINQTHWAGSIEIHTKASDWIKHKHHTDPAYNNVILHVVYENDQKIVNQNGQIIPCLELKKYINPTLLTRYTQNLLQKFQFIPCEKSLAQLTDKSFLTHYFSRLNAERLENKNIQLQKILAKNNNHWEAILFNQLAQYLIGSTLNKEATQIWLQSFTFEQVQKCQQNLTQLIALFLGQAGFLSTPSLDTYQGELEKEYRFLQSKFSLTDCSSSNFRFFGVRPPNYPIIRMIQLACLYYQQKQLFQNLINTRDYTALKTYFNITLPNYWNTHYHFSKKYTTPITGKITENTFSNLLINVIIPLKYIYLNHIEQFDFDEIESILSKIKAENNKIISNFGTYNLQIKTAWESQALLELKNKYCNHFLCLNCEIGWQILNKKA